MNSLIKQKEAIVKQEIQNTEKIIEQQGVISNLKFAIEDLNDKLEEANLKATEEKDNNRKLNLKLKNSQQDQTLLQENISKLQVKLKEKDQ